MRASASALWLLGSTLAAALVSLAACGQTGDTSSGANPTDATTSSGGGLPITTSTSSSTGGAGVGGTNLGGSAGAGGEPLATSGITIIVEPDGQSGDEIVNAIRAATTSVHMTMYILSDDDTIRALIDRHDAGVDVRVVLNQTFPSSGSDSGSNDDAFHQLEDAHVPVKWASSQFTYTHEKCIVIDAATAWIMTMNSAHSSPDQNREYLAVDTIPDHVAEAETIFEGDYNMPPLTSVTGPLVVAPINAHAALDSFIATAKTSIDLEGEELSDEAILDALIAAFRANVMVRVVLADNTPTSAQQGAINRLNAVGIPAVKLSDPYVHAKVIVVDREAAYVGSANFTTASLEDNRELGVLFAVPSEIAKINATIDQDFQNGVPLQ